MNNIGLYIDGENIAYKHYTKLFEIVDKIKGKLIYKKLYNDFGLIGNQGKYDELKEYMLNNCIQPIQVINNKGKNSADMKIQFDIFDDLEKSIIDTYIIASGDADFIGIVNKIKEKGKNIIGIGLNKSSATILKNSCDEYYTLDDKTDSIEYFRKNLLKLLDSYDENKISLSKIKYDILSKDSSLNEQNYNYKKFSSLIKDVLQSNVKFKLINNQFLEIIN